MTEWGPLIVFTHHFYNKQWSWLENHDLKYLDIRLDTRDMCCNVTSSSGRVLTVDDFRQLKKFDQIHLSEKGYRPYYNEFMKGIFYGGIESEKVGNNFK